MGLPITKVRPGDWDTVRRNFDKIKSNVLGPNANVTYAGLTLSGLTASRLVQTNSSKGLSSVSNLANWIAGTSNQIIVTDDGDGTITLSAPQDLHTGAGPTFANLILSKTCTLADGLNVLRVTGLQTDGTAMTGTLRGAYIDVSNGNTTATGTIRGMELKARTEAPGDTGNDVNVLEGLSISADSKGHSVTTMRAAEFIIDGTTGGTITEAVGLRIANNLQANKATTSYGLQIYRDSFDYTADIQLSNGGLIGGSTGALKITSGGNVGIGVTPSYKFSIGSTDGSDQIGMYHDNTDAYLKWNDGSLILQTDEGTNSHSIVEVHGKGTGVGVLYFYDEDEQEYAYFQCISGAAELGVYGTTITKLRLQQRADAPITCFDLPTEGKTQQFQLSGFRTADQKRTLGIDVGGTYAAAANTVGFGGLSNYRFVGTVNAVTAFQVNGTQVLTTQQAHIVDATTQDLAGTDTIDETKLESDLSGIVSTINSILSTLETHGLVASA